MCTHILIWLAIGFIVAFANNHIYSISQTEKEKYEEKPGMILALFIWILLWPIGVYTLIKMLSAKHNN